MSREQSIFQSGQAIPEEEALGLFLSSLPGLVDQAVVARKTKSASYRGMRVGAAAFGVNPYTGESFSGSAGNIKTSKHIQTKCAETQAIESVRASGALVLMGLVVVSTRDRSIIEGITHHQTHTLHPCHRCLSDFPSDGITSRDTLVITGGTKSPAHKVTRPDVLQAHTIAELEFMYRGDGNPELEQHQPLRNLRMYALPDEFDRLVRKAVDKEGIVEPAQLAIQAFANCAD